MSSSFTVNNGLEKPGAGEQEGQWGGTLNTNFDIIDRVLSGVGSVALSGTTHTLTTSDGALSDGQFKVINFTGALGANNTITISPNDQDKLYFIINATTDSGSSGPYSIIIKQGSGATVTIPNGGFDIVIADGAGSGAAVTSLLSKKITTGQLTTTGNVLIPDAGTIGSASDPDAISISSGGVVDFTQVPTFPNDTIETADIQDDAVTQAKIADDAVGADQLASDAVVTASITDGNVTTAKVADDAITLAKMAGLARGKIIVGDSNGDPSALALGSNGEVLKSDGSDLVFGSVSASVALDDIGVGDAESTLATSAGNIIIDAQGSDTDIIFKGTDNGVDTTFLTLDGSNAGTATFNNQMVIGGNVTIDGDNSETAIIRFRTTSTFNGSFAMQVFASRFFVCRKVSTATAVFTSFHNSSGTQIGTITASESATAYNTTSDYRLKENVVNITDGIARLKQLKPKRFNFIMEPDITLDGFLAHEVTAVPEAISGEKDGMVDIGTLKDKEGNIIGTKQEKPDDLHITGYTFEKTGETEEYQGIDQSKLVPLLTAALQEAVTEIESLKTRVAALEGS